MIGSLACEENKVSGPTVTVIQLGAILVGALRYTSCIIFELSAIHSGPRTQGSQAIKADEILKIPSLQSAR